MTTAITCEPDATDTRVGLPVVIFDGDDTLWMTEKLYDDARTAAAAKVAHAGLDAGRWIKLELDIDVANVAKWGLSAERFPRSCVEAYGALCAESAMPVDPVVSELVRSAASSVFRHRAPLAPHARTTLESLRASHRLVLLTQGDRSVQLKRIADSELESYFDIVCIVPAKSVATLRTLIERLQIDAPRSWFVGNSVPSDVNPALACGMRAIWVDAHVWDHERREVPMWSDRLRASDSLLLVPSLILGEA